MDIAQINTPEAAARPHRPELHCDECFEKLDEYVDLQLGSAVADDQISGMRPPGGCSACHQDYDSPRGLIQEGEANN